ncbi:DUF916 domain-containing protein [Streptomyces sp. NBC_01267]|uniref:COG1470 family protein n=1 Tax=Streptomyces sp. NBC_01267 TaxID=2903805 RepID=UPI002E372FA7|nr:hypothetical protein [Streptomyces sp. NBC_01267]
MPTRIVRSAALTAAVLLCSALSALVPAHAAGPAAGDHAWTAAPASGGGSRPGEDGRPYFYLEGAAGTVLEDTLTLTNPGTKPVSVRLRGAEAYNTASGAFAIRGTDDSWITPAVRTVKLPARTRADVPFSVTVPATAAPGDHPAAIVASAGGRQAGVRVQLRVSGPTLSALTVEDVGVDKGRGLIRYTVVNRGNTALTPKLEVRADGLFGRVLHRAPHALPMEVLPGQRVRLTEKWPHPPALDSVRVRVTLTAGGGAHGTGTASAVFVPWAWVAGLAAVVALGAGAWFVRRRRPAEPERAPAAGSDSGDGADGADGNGDGADGADGNDETHVKNSEPATAGAAT